MVQETGDLNKRLEKLEIQNKQEALALVEILSNAEFFGQLKQSECRYARDGQCGLFTLNTEQRDHIPITSKCRIKECKEPNAHWHIELSTLTCTLCKGDH